MHVNELGVKHDSGLFIRAFEVIGGMSKATIETKIELYKSYGWSESETVFAFRKFPGLFSISEQNIRATMSFLVEKVGYKSKMISDGSLRIPGIGIRTPHPFWAIDESEDRFSWLENNCEMISDRVYQLPAIATVVKAALVSDSDVFSPYLMNLSGE
ncbi:hypothetical protein GIB67_016905 [Kingdonia uniflora]|uniref:Uncharacterized protein n=1 Tax=Kingdonia uniflora TaxID=39325 RepID=A0A7J7M3D7_9MAGN|nr:hypothetical protein GIB67_016905 [Kingdonia uniflora]